VRTPIWSQAAFKPLAIAALGLLAGCSTQMRLAPELAVAQEIPVQDRQHWSRPMAFGRWQAAAPATYTTRAWRFGASLPPLPRNAELAVSGEKAGVQFDLISPASAMTHGNCLAQGKFASYTTYGARTTDETSVTLPGFPRLDCEFTGTQTGVLTLRADFATQRDSGEAEIDGRRWQVRSVNNFQGQQGSFPLARFGYEVVLENRVVAAVETQGNGRIWMLPGLPPAQQDELSTLMTALLYYGTLLDQQDA
jgi:hypothetical protein